MRQTLQSLQYLRFTKKIGQLIIQESLGVTLGARPNHEGEAGCAMAER